MVAAAVRWTLTTSTSCSFNLMGKGQVIAHEPGAFPKTSFYVVNHGPKSLLC